MGESAHPPPPRSSDDPRQPAPHGARLPPSLTEQRLAVVLDVASRFQTGVPLDSLVDLLPPDGPRTAAELEQWMNRARSEGVVVGDRVFKTHSPEETAELDRRRARGEIYLGLARKLVGETLRPALGLLRSIEVTGSTAYGDPKLDDDCDFLVVAREGALWLFIGYLYLRLRFAPPSDSEGPLPRWCFNYVVDERTILADFSRPQGFLFAREALTARPIYGEEFYQGLVGSNDWLRQEAPRLFARWGVGTPAKRPPTRPSSWPIRAASLATFPWVAAYLQLVGLIRNHRHRRAGHSEECFRTVTKLDRMTFVSEKFERLIDLYGPATALPRG